VRPVPVPLSVRAGAIVVPWDRPGAAPSINRRWRAPVPLVPVVVRLVGRSSVKVGWSVWKMRVDGSEGGR
jgi:hypothetical protein